MNKKRFFISFTAIALLVMILELSYLIYKKKAQDETLRIKQATVRIISLPDLALSTEARFIRHRSLSDFASIFNEDGTLHDYFPSGFVYSAPNYQSAYSGIELER